MRAVRSPSSRRTTTRSGPTCGARARRPCARSTTPSSHETEAGPTCTSRRSSGASSGGLLQRERRLPPVGQVVDVDRDDPFDPPVATAARRDEPGRKAVPWVELVDSATGREQKRSGFLEREAAVVSRARDDANALALAGGKQSVETHTAPVLSRVEAAGAVEGGGQAVIECGELCVGP